MDYMELISDAHAAAPIGMEWSGSVAHSSGDWGFHIRRMSVDDCSKGFLAAVCAIASSKS